MGFHGLAFVLLGVAMPWLHFAPPTDTTPPEERAPIVFDIIESPAMLSQTQPPEEARHLSDKNVSARNLDSPEDLPVGETYGPGISTHSDYANPASSRQMDARKNALQDQRHPMARDPSGSSPEFRRELLLRQQTDGASEQAAPSDHRPLLENRETRAPELGTFAINTYAWDFAPYLLWLKNRVEENIFPPPAFTYMGMISGQTQLRFRIYPDGGLEALQVLKTIGHRSLMETSVRAVELSAPLRPLPANFPEEFLEVTALFEYLVQGR